MHLPPRACVFFMVALIKIRIHEERHCIYNLILNTIDDTYKSNACMALTLLSNILLKRHDFMTLFLSPSSSTNSLCICEEPFTFNGIRMNVLIRTLPSLSAHNLESVEVAGHTLVRVRAHSAVDGTRIAIVRGQALQSHVSVGACTM